ncbi:MAG: shikimate kinase [Bacteroidales bacterium]|nr:shikimate kinase [Bacteroidales bacterium]
MRIFLIGFMGSGKTTAGKQLASRLSYRYFDLDEFIEQQEQDSIRKIFEKKGEPYFRKKESKYLRDISHYEDCVISTGGGAPCFFDNMDYMNNTGITVYLKMKPEQLVSRLKDGREERPLIKNKDDQELLQFIRDKLSERETYYSKAHMIVDGFNLNINELLDKIRAFLKQ